MDLSVFRNTGNLPGLHSRNLPSAGHASGPRKRAVKSADESLLCAAASCRSHALRFVSVALLIVGVSVAGWSQASFKAQLRGAISDASGALIPNATVTLTDEATGTALVSKTDSEGRYTFLNLEPASYMLDAEAQGFGGQKREHLVLRVAQESVLDLKLAVAGVATSVQVTDAPVLLNDSDAELGTEVTSRYINEVPLFDRQIEKLAYLSPGVVTSQGYATDQTNENFSSSGQRNSSAEIRLDGALTSTPEAGEGAMNWAHFQPSIEIIQEFKMQTSASSAEYGSNGGTVMNMVTKSGANKLHGSAYWFGRNSATDANNWYAGGAPLAPYKKNIEGGSIGGHIIKNRLFYFGHYENTQYSAPSTVRTTVPTDAEKSGDFSSTLGTDANGNPVPITIYDPYNGRTKYQGSQIPSSEITPLAKNVMALYPKPTDSGDAFHQNNFTKNYANAQPAHQYNARVDWTITKTNQLSTRYSKGYLERQSPSDFEGNIGQGDERNDYNNAVSEYTHTFSSTIFLSARAALDRHHQLRDAANTTDLIAMGFSPEIVNMNGYITFPQIGINGEQGLGLSGYTKTIEAETGANFDVSLSWVKGAHSFKFGGERRFLYDNFFQPAAPGGQFGYSPSHTRSSEFSTNPWEGSGLADFLIDFGSSGGISVHPPVAEKSSEIAFFVQDDWKVTPRLTINLGLRWEESFPYNSRHNQMQFANFTEDSGVNLDLSSGDPFLQSIGLGPTEILGVADFANSHHRTEGVDNSNFGPRFGIAYRWGQHTVLSAGGGLYYGINPATGFQDQGSVYRKYVNWIPTLDNGATVYATLENPWPNGYSGPQGTKYGKLNMWGFGSDANQSTAYRNAEIYQWNVSVQRELPGNALLTVAWSANKSTHLSFGDGAGGNKDFLSESKRAAISLQQHALDPNCDTDNCVTNFLNKQVANPFYSLFNGPGAIFNEPDSSFQSSTTMPLINLLRPYPQFNGDFSAYYNFGASSFYNALQLKFEKRYNSGANILTSYTLAKGMDNASSNSNGWLGNDPGYQALDELRWGEWSVSANDVRQRLVVGGRYELPIGRGKQFGSNMNRAVDAVVGGWQTNAYLTYQGGQPLHITMANSHFSDGGQRPNLTGLKPRTRYSEHEVAKNNYWFGGNESMFNSDAFSDPGDNNLGNTPRFDNDLRGDSIKDLDFSIIKNFTIHEGHVVQIRVESFNLTNTPQFNDPNNGWGSGSFGFVSGQVNSPRQLQFGVHYAF